MCYDMKVRILPSQQILIKIMKNIKKLLLENGFIYKKGLLNELPYFIKNEFKVYFSEYDLNNFYIPIITSDYVQLYWTNDFNEILKYYENKTSKKN